MVVKKKVVKKVVKKITKKKVSKKDTRRVYPDKSSKKISTRGKVSKVQVLTSKKKINFILKNVLFFLVLGIISYILMSVTGKEIYSNLFELLMMVFGFIALAFFLVLLILLFMKSIKRRK
jgi:sorbitol-specific phosphotransferase system component IIBC